VARDALQWAKERSANMEITALPERLGGRLIPADNGTALELPYFDDVIVIDENRMGRPDGTELSHWEQVFVYNHMAQGGKRRPTGKWKAFREFPNTVSKIKNMVTDVEVPLVERFQGRLADLEAAALSLGGQNVTADFESVDRAIAFRPLPRIPVLLMFWDAAPDDGFEAQVKLLFDETIVVHLDIESIVFLSERLSQMLCSG
jgi:hypothetical protein